MKKLGRVVSFDEKKIVLKTDELVKIGSEVYDEGERHVGTVIEYFGPTMGPYVIIGTKMNKKDVKFLVGKTLYG